MQEQSLQLIDIDMSRAKNFMLSKSVSRFSRARKAGVSSVFRGLRPLNIKFTG